MDREFGRPDYDPDDQGEFEEGLVFVIMTFRCQEMADAYAAIKDECKKLRLRAKRVDENTGSGLVIMKAEELKIKYPAGFESAVHMTKDEMERHIRFCPTHRGKLHGETMVIEDI